MRRLVRPRAILALAVVACIAVALGVSILTVPSTDAVASAPAASAAPPPVLHVRGMIVDPRKPPALGAALTAKTDTGYAIVQHAPARGNEVHKAITAAGGKHLGPIARDGFFVGGLTLKQLRAIPGVVYADSYHPAYKLEPELRSQLAAAAGSTKKVLLAVSVFRDAPGTAKAIAAFGGKARVVPVGVAGESGLDVTVAIKDLPKLAALPQVRDVERAMIPMPLLDSAPSIALTHIRSNGAPPWTNVDNLTGANQVLGVYDTGCDNGITGALVPDLRNRVIGDTANWTNPMDLGGPSWADVNYFGQPSAHGSFVSDIAIGDGSSSVGGLLTGVAFAATEIIRPFNADSVRQTPNNLNITRALTNARAAHATVHNDSWDPATGTFPTLVGVDNVYSAGGSLPLDAFLTASADNAVMLIVTSAGNSGRGGARTLGTLSCSKNSLAVGNTGNGQPPTGAVPPNDAGQPTYPAATPTNQMRVTSSQGPTPAGQLRPDVCAPGAMVAARCPQSNCPGPPYRNQPNFTYQVGTSFSAPVVSGAALLLREYLETRTNLPHASGMLTKALLINGASPVYNYVPDNVQGWGRINLQQSINGFGGGDTYYYDSLTEPGAAFVFTQSGQSVVFPNVNFAGGVPLAITLVWYDPPNGIPDGTLVDDLDLTLTLSDGTTVYQGGVPSMNLGVSQPGGAADRINTSEKLILAATPGGACTITVTATTIAGGQRQPFALVVTSVDHQGQQAQMHQLKRKR